MLFKLKQGFTVVELLIVLAVMGIILGIIYGSFSGFRNQQILNSGTEDVLSVLNQAHSKTLAAKSGYRYGVHMASTTVTLFQGATYNAGAASNQVITLASGAIVMNTAVVGGGLDVVFDRLTGKTSQPGTIRLEVANNPSKNRTITITSTGIIGVN